MSLTVYLRPEAEADIDEAAAWYERQRESLGHQFLEETLNAFERIAAGPEMYPALYRGTRRAVIHRFPFAVFYRVEDDSILVIAVMHGSRHPRRWKERN